MPDLKPFRAYRYRQDAVALGDVVAPPYDVIAPPEREALYKCSPYNAIRLILGREDDPYREAKQAFDHWRDAGTLVRDIDPAIYLLAQSFTDREGERYTRTGFVAACRLEEAGKGTIFPHERTLAKPVEDRLRLFHATGAMFSQVFLLYSDPDGITDRIVRSSMDRRPDGELVFDGVENRFWRLTDQRSILSLQTMMAKRRVTIADGHHRYETALAYATARRVRNPKHTGKEPYNFVPVYCTNLSDPGLKILPTHRILRGYPKFSPRKFLADAAGRGSVGSFGTMEQLGDAMASNGRSVGILLPGDRQCHLVEFPAPPQSDGQGGIPILDGLDVTLLQQHLLKGALGMSDDDLSAKRYLDYVIDAEVVVDRLRDGSGQAGFLLHAPSAEIVRMVAEAGLTMPQKSTYFYPKLLSGLFTYSFEEE